MTSKQQLEENFINAAKLLATSGKLFHQLSEAEQREFFESEAADAILMAFTAIAAARAELYGPDAPEQPNFDPSLN